MAQYYAFEVFSGIGRHPRVVVWSPTEGEVGEAWLSDGGDPSKAAGAIAEWELKDSDRYEWVVDPQSDTRTKDAPYFAKVDTSGTETGRWSSSGPNSSNFAQESDRSLCETCAHSAVCAVALANIVSATEIMVTGCLQFTA